MLNMTFQAERKLVGTISPGEPPSLGDVDAASEDVQNGQRVQKSVQKEGESARKGSEITQIISVVSKNPNYR